MTLDNIAQSLQVAISPAILISAIGLLMLSMTNRIGRVVDRVRQLTRERRQASQTEQAMIDQQLVVLSRRAVFLRRAVMFITLSLLCVAMMILCLFLAAVMSVDEAVTLILVLFFSGVVCLVASLYFFLLDITMGLSALHVEMPEPGAEPGIDQNEASR